MVQITTKGDKNRVTGVMALPKGTQAPAATNPIEYFSLEPGEFKPEIFGNFSEKMQAMIANSPEYKSAIGMEVAGPEDYVPDFTEQLDPIPF